MTITELKTILSEGRFRDLVGVLETEHVDFKAQPYQLTTEKQKYDLLEDVVSFANHEGGIIILGCRTISAEVEGDKVEEIREIPVDKIDFESYRSLVNDHIYPQIKGFILNFHPSVENPSEGLASIEIPKASVVDAPHLIAHIVSHTGKRQTTKYGLAVRTGARNSSYPVQTIHGHIKMGASIGNFESSALNIERQLSLLLREAELQKLGSSLISSTENKNALERLLPSLLIKTGFAETPSLVMAAFPTSFIELRDIYDRATAVSKAFDSPPELRTDGFDLTFDERSVIVDGSLRRRQAHASKMSQLSTKGQLIAIVRADEDFLAWFQRRGEGQPIRYSSYVLTEITYIFSAYLKAIFQSFANKPLEFDVMVGLQNCFVDNVAPLLGTRRDHRPDLVSFGTTKAAPRPSFIETFRIPESVSVEHLAFELRAALYHQFGFSDEQIPYAVVGEGGRITSAEEITDPNRR